MPKKRKTLVKEFQVIIDSGDLDAFRAVFDRCEIDAVEHRGSSCNAFHFRGLTPAHIQFLIDEGLDPNGNCGFHQTAAAYQAYSEENLDCLLKNGADLNLVLTNYAGNALHHATLCRDETAIRNLVDRGADPQIRCGLDERTPLENLLMSSSNADLPKIVPIARYLLSVGAQCTPQTQAAVKRLGKNFEFYRPDFSPDHVDVCSDALEAVYTLFDVEPVPRRVIYDGKSPIRVKGETWQEQHQALWDLLVPGRGAASTVQGEVIRIVGKVLYEILDNGGMNWDAEFHKLLQALVEYLRQGDGLDAALTEEACQLAQRVTPHSGQKELYRLNELAVAWVLANPMPCALPRVNYKR